MIIVAGALTVDPDGRDAYLKSCAAVVAAAREVPECLDFGLGPDLLEPSRINVFERWESEDALQRFRGSGPDEGQLAALLSVDVGEYVVAELPR